ncbi:Holliday junction resolvase RuvX [Candidatus Saccharibacteria bacterium]|nr:Holliday junction resolvase RuvX [Candidatus Saccharibacteria bacterium]
MGEEHIALAVEQALLGIDHGDKRIGLAYKPHDSSTPEAIGVYANSPSFMSQLSALATKLKVDTVVVGLPRDIHGNDTAQTLKARAFAGRLADETGLHIILHDEFTTSERARERLGAKSRDELKRQLDAVSAVILLEDYLGSMA